MSRQVLPTVVLAFAAVITPSSSYAASKASFWQSFYAWLNPSPDEGCIPSEVDDCGVQEPQ